MDPLALAPMVIAGVVIDFAWLALLLRLRKGRFEIGRDDRLAFTATTDFGRFTLDRARGLVRYQEDKSPKELALAAIQRFDFGLTSRWAAAEEFFLTSFDIWDVFERYQDRINWYQISIVPSGGNRIPTFIIGQYEPREPLLGSWFEFQASVLGKLGLFAAAEERAREVLERLQLAFRESGREITLATAASPPVSAVNPGQRVAGDLGRPDAEQGAADGAQPPSRRVSEPRS